MKNTSNTKGKAVFNYNSSIGNIYYDLATKGNASFPQHVAFNRIRKYLQKDCKVCEFGCGDGSKLVHFKQFTNDITGFDLSRHAINKARKLLPNAIFYDKDMSEVFEENSFDVTMTFYALEHVQNPESFINNMLRVTKPGGHVIGLCPNFGSPLFPSPPELLKAKSLMEKLALLTRRMSSYKKAYLNSIFRSVRPATNVPFQPDYDTVSEVSLAAIVLKYDAYLTEASSFWKFERKFFVFFPYLFLAIMGKLGVFPFKFWGPICFFVLRKR